MLCQFTAVREFCFLSYRPGPILSCARCSLAGTVTNMATTDQSSNGLKSRGATVQLLEAAADDLPGIGRTTDRAKFEYSMLPLERNANGEGDATPNFPTDPPSRMARR